MAGTKRKQSEDGDGGGGGGERISDPSEGFQTLSGSAKMFTLSYVPFKPVSFEVIC